MLEDLLRQGELAEKKKRLADKHGLKMTEEIERRINEMCNLSERIEEKGIEKGFEKGIEKGIEKGRANVVKDMLSNGKTLEQIADFCGYELEYVKAIEKNK